jgi:hypothetical protein
MSVVIVAIHCRPWGATARHVADRLCPCAPVSAGTDLLTGAAVFRHRESGIEAETATASNAAVDAVELEPDLPPAPMNPAIAAALLGWANRRGR